MTEAIDSESGAEPGLTIMSGGQGFRLRPANASDAELLRAWRNDAVTRAASRSTAEVGEAEHLAWLGGVLTDPSRLLLVAEHDGRPIGQVRLDAAGKRWEINVSLSPDARGRGFGAALIRRGVERLRAQGGQGPVEAWIRAENLPSLRAFRRAGFVDDPERSGREFTVLVRAS
jgi:RimJ/RimL family protein N-acetyltransferase